MFKHYCEVGSIYLFLVLLCVACLHAENVNSSYFVGLVKVMKLLSYGMIMNKNDN